jgi:Spy/CpxP family protein refolding chaperone
MKRRTTKILIAVAAVVLVSVAVAQMGPGAGPGFGMGPGWSGDGPGWGRGGPGGWGYGYMGNNLNLTEAQQKKAQSIFDTAEQQMRQLRDQMHDKRRAFWNSQKPLSDAEIDKLTAERADLSAKMQATRMKAFNNFYNNVLTSEQRAKYEQLRASSGPGPGMGSGRGRDGWGGGFCPGMRGW